MQSVEIWKASLSWIVNPPTRGSILWRCGVIG
jgi:hypothetical protein